MLSSRPSDPPIINTIWLSPVTERDSIFSESCSDESCFPSTQREIIYAPFGIFAAIFSASLFKTIFCCPSSLGSSLTCMILSLQNLLRRFLYSSMAAAIKLLFYFSDANQSYIQHNISLFKAYITIGAANCTAPIYLSVWFFFKFCLLHGNVAGFLFYIFLFSGVTVSFITSSAASIASASPVWNRASNSSPSIFSFSSKSSATFLRFSIFSVRITLHLS